MTEFYELNPETHNVSEFELFFIEAPALSRGWMLIAKDSDGNQIGNGSHYYLKKDGMMELARVLLEFRHAKGVVYTMNGKIQKIITI